MGYTLINIFFNSRRVDRFGGESSVLDLGLVLDAAIDRGRVETKTLWKASIISPTAH